MSRASVVYLLMIVVFVAGLWAVMAIGGRLAAPEDLRGRWVAVEGADAASRWSGMSVQQSGEFFQLAFDGGPSDVAVTMHGRADDGRLSLARGPWHVTIDPPTGRPAVRTFHVEGPTSGTFTGRRPGATTAATAARGNK